MQRPKRPEALIVSLGSERKDPPMLLAERLTNKPRGRRTLEEKLAAAQTKRQEMITGRKRTAALRSPTSTGSSEERAAKLQTRMSMADRLRAAQLEQRKAKALKFLARRAGALARASARREQQLARLEESQLAALTAESRRAYLQGQHLQKLKSEHEQIKLKMEMRSMDGDLRASQRRLLEERMSLADQARTLILGLRSTRAGIRVARARTLSKTAQARRLDHVQTARDKLEERMQGAEMRRQAVLEAVKAHASPPRSPCLSPGAQPPAIAAPAAEARNAK